MAERPNVRSASWRKLLFALALLLMVAVCGTIGFKLLIPQNTWIDALFMTAITISTVGLGPVHPLGQAGEVFAIFLIIGGAASVSMALTQGAGLVVEEVFSSQIGRRRMDRKIQSLKGHTIICGFGRMGSAVAEIFAREKIPFVVIEDDPETLVELQERGYLYVRGDATSDDVLQDAGLERAASLVALLRTDADNLFVTLSARQLNPAISVIVRAEDESGARKLSRAGATRIITPYLSGAHRLANAAIRPAFIDFIEALTEGPSDLGFQFEEMTVDEGSAAAGKTLASLHLGQSVGVIVVAIMRTGNKMEFNPGGRTELSPGDTLIVIGTPEQFAQMRQMLSRS